MIVYTIKSKNFGAYRPDVCYNRRPKEGEAFDEKSI